MHQLKAWILAARPKTLPAAVAPVAVGAALVWKLADGLAWGLVWATLLSATAIQIATNFFNDALDHAKGADTAKRLGPTRATAAGLISSRAMFWAAGLTLLLAIGFGWPLLMARGWPILAIGLPSLYFSFGYTGGPWPLAYRGMGEAFVMLFFGFIAVSGTVFVLTGSWPVHGLVAGFQIGLLSTVLIAINNLRDVDEDTSTQKRTLAVRLGIPFARYEIAACCLLPHAIGLVAWPMLGCPLLAYLPLLAMILGGLITRGVWKNAPSPLYNKYLAVGGAQLVLFTLLFVLAVVKY